MKWIGSAARRRRIGGIGDTSRKRNGARHDDVRQFIDRARRRSDCRRRGRAAPRRSAQARSDSPSQAKAAILSNSLGSGVYPFSGVGGSSLLGGAGRGASASSTAAVVEASQRQGGNAGSAGGTGILVVTEHCLTPRLWPVVRCRSLNDQTALGACDRSPQENGRAASTKSCRRPDEAGS